MNRAIIFLILIFGLVNTGFSQNHLPQNYARGLHYFSEFDFPQALKSFQETVSLHPDYFPAYEKIIQCYHALGIRDSARTFFERLKQNYPKAPFAYYALGRLYLEQKNYEKAIHLLKHSVELSPPIYATYRELAKAYYGAARLSEAYQLLNKRIEANPQNSLANYGLTYVLILQHRWEHALSRLNTALKLNPHLLDAYRLKATLLRDQFGNLKQAIAVCDTALTIAEEINDPDFTITFLIAKSTVLLNAGESARAIEVTRNAVEKSEAANLIDRKAEALSNLGVIYRQTGENEQALTVLNQSLRIFRALKDMFGEQKVLSNMGDVFLTTGAMDSVKVYYEKALSLAKAVGADRDIAASYGQLATLYFYLGNYEQSASYSDSAIHIYRQIDYKPGLTSESGNLGTVYYVLGQYEKALKYFDDAREQAAYLGDKYLQEINLGNIGSIYVLLEDYSLAQRYLEKAYQIAREISSRPDEATWLGALSTARLALGDTTTAIQNLEEALSILKAVNDWRNIAITYANLGTIYTRQGKYELAEQHFRQALEINRNIHNAFGIAETHNNLGILYLEQKQFGKAREQFRTALEQGNRLPSPKTIWDARYGLGRVEEGLGNLSAAVDHYRQAVEIIESVRGELVATELKTSFLTGKVEVYHQLINLLYQLFQRNKDSNIMEEAFHYAERAKARTLLDLLAESRIEIRSGVNSDLLNAEKTQMRNISEIQTHLTTAQLKPEERETLLSRLQQYEDELRRIRTEIRKENPFYAQLKFPRPITLKELQKNLPEDVYLFEYALGKSHSYLWIIGKNECQWEQLPGRPMLAARITRFSGMLNRPPGVGVPIEAYGEKLANLLLGPALEFLPQKAHLIIIPDGELHYLPFETLIVPGDRNQTQLLVESHPISYASSASVLFFLNHRISSRYAYDLLAFGDPVFAVEDTTPDVNQQLYTERGLGFSRLPYTSREVEEIARLFPRQRTKIYLRSRASEENLKSENGRLYRILHFATHGLIDEKTPDRSCIVLSIDEDPAEDGFLQVQEIFDLKLNAQLVTLSACQTGRGKLVRGEGIIGFSQAFFYAGARSLLVSLWSVADQSTSQLMGNFYRFLQEGYSISDALRLAKLKFIRNSNRSLRHPYYWAPFVLRGAIQ